MAQRRHFGPKRNPIKIQLPVNEGVEVARPKDGGEGGGAAIEQEPQAEKGGKEGEGHWQAVSTDVVCHLIKVNASTTDRARPASA